MQASEPTILIVDDEEMVASALRALLELETEYNVLAFTSPLVALAEVERGTPVHVVIADFMMPEMDGVTFLRQVRDKRPFTSRLLLTGYAGKENAIRSINEAGLYYYLEKPWNNDDLGQVIRNGVERATLLQELEARVAALEQANEEMSSIRRRLIKAFV
jgi:response regulator RpfG family c-di-GMP phosphodiesterase